MGSNVRGHYRNQANREPGVGVDPSYETSDRNLHTTLATVQIAFAAEAADSGRGTAGTEGRSRGRKRVGADVRMALSLIRRVEECVSGAMRGYRNQALVIQVSGRVPVTLTEQYQKKETDEADARC